MNLAFLNMPIEFYSGVSGGAISTIICNVAKHLHKQPDNVTVISRLGSYPKYPYGSFVQLEPCGAEDLSFWQRRLSGVRWRFHDWDWPFYDYYRSAFESAIRSLPSRPDAVIVFNDFISPVHLKALLPDTRIFVWLQNEQRTRMKNMPESIKATDGWLTCSDYIRDWTAREHSFPRERIKTVPSGVCLETFRPREHYLETRGPVRVLFVGRMDPNKGVDLAVDAVAALQAEGLQVSITVVGGRWFYGHGHEAEDPYFCELRAKMEAARATYLGHVTRDHIAEVFREHDIVCVLSRSNEPFGLVVLEAMASGCAVVASNRGGLPEASGGAAMLVDPDDRQSVLAAMRRLVTDPDALSQAKRASVARASNASWKVTAERFTSALASI